MRRFHSLRDVLACTAVRGGTKTAGACDQNVRPYSRQHHAGSAVGWISTDRRLLVAGQSAYLFSLEAGRRAAPERNEPLRRESRRQGPASFDRRGGETSAARERRVVE